MAGGVGPALSVHPQQLQRERRWHCPRSRATPIPQTDQLEDETRLTLASATDISRLRCQAHGDPHHHAGRQQPKSWRGDHRGRPLPREEMDWPCRPSPLPPVSPLLSHGQDRVRAGDLPPRQPDADSGNRYLRCDRLHLIGGKPNTLLHVPQRTTAGGTQAHHRVHRVQGRAARRALCQQHPPGLCPGPGTRKAPPPQAAWHGTWWPC